MKTLSLAFLALILASCGQQEKSDDPFGKASNPQRGTPPMTDREFQNTCNRRSGALVEGGKLCMYTAHSKIYDREKLEKEFGDAGGFIFVKIGKVMEGSLLWADVKGGQTVTFFLNGHEVANMTNERLAPRHLRQGELTMRVFRGVYEHLNVFVAQCIQRNGTNHHCPK